MLFLLFQGLDLQDARSLVALRRVRAPGPFLRWERDSGFFSWVSLPGCPSQANFLVSRILTEQRRLKEEEKQAELSFNEAQRKLEEVHRDLVGAQRDLMERLSRLRRLRQQREHLVEKGGDMVRRGLASLDEMEEAEREESEAIVEAPVGDGVDID